MGRRNNRKWWGKDRLLIYKNGEVFMKDLLDELLTYVSDSMIILYVSLGVILLTIVTHFIFKKYSRYIKYIPGTIIILIGIFNLFGVLDSLVENESLNALMTFVIFVVSGFVGIFTGLILGVYEKPMKKIKKDKKEEEVEEVVKEVEEVVEEEVKEVEEVKEEQRA